jgi:starvation-inducible DNA-binding protein
MMNKIGLNLEKAKLISNKLNGLLSDYQIFYQNVRGFHWNVRGEKFFELHLKFEELYNNLQVKIDELAERILTLGETPLHSFNAYLQNCTIKPVQDMKQGKECMKNVLDSFEQVIIKQRELLQIASEANDEGTNALMSDYIREQEKLVWMYSAFLG